MYFHFFSFFFLCVYFLDFFFTVVGALSVVRVLIVVEEILSPYFHNIPL